MEKPSKPHELERERVFPRIPMAPRSGAALQRVVQVDCGASSPHAVH